MHVKLVAFYSSHICVARLKKLLTVQNRVTKDTTDNREEKEAKRWRMRAKSKMQ